MIPKIIHQTWRSDSLPSLFKNIKEHNEKLNSDFEFKLWDNENVIELMKNEYNEIYDIFCKCKIGVQKADLIRIVMLYHYGGVYVDADILCLKSLQTLIDFEAEYVYLSMEPVEQTKKLYNNESVVCNAFMVSPPKHAIFKTALEEIKEVYKTNGDMIFNVFNVFGGDLISKSIMSNTTLCKFINRKLIYPINDPKFSDLPSSEIEATMLKTGNYNNAYLVHYWIHSDFESRELIEKFKYDDNESIHHNVHRFFRELYPANLLL